jgi:lysophospholipid acyltransferase (LPLAT)-like uncharacterized protein
MKKFKRRLKRKLNQVMSSQPLAFLLVMLIRLIYTTMRITVVGREILPGFAARDEGYVGAFWHARIIMIPFLYPGKALHILVSRHRDGEIIANILKRFGFHLVRGSSSKGGGDALREMMRLLRSDQDLGIAADGPRGPAEVLKPGAAQLGRLSGKPVIPISFSASRSIRSTSWDRFMFPLPFSRGVFVVGEPVRYEKGEDMEDYRLRIENALRRVTAKADEMTGIRSGAVNV